MAKPEQRVWKNIRDAMAGKWSAQRHEDRYSSGIPDVSFSYRDKGSCVSGWIELKSAPKMTPLPDGERVLKISHLTAEQVAWMLDRYHHGGFCVLIIRVVEDKCWVFVPIWRLSAWSPGDSIPTTGSDIRMAFGNAGFINNLNQLWKLHKRYSRV